MLVVGGFLGAGKTTLINHWLVEASETGRRIVVLVNDFGAINIDATSIVSHGSDVIELTNGCVCCSIGNDLAHALIRLLDSQRHVDAILVEASGVSDPWRIAQIALAEPQLRLAGVVVLVDASAVGHLSADPQLADTLVQQVKSADLVLLNKMDLADAAAAEFARDWVARHAPNTLRSELVACALPLSPLLDGCESSGQSTVCTEAVAFVQENAHEAQFERWSTRPSVRFDMDALRGRFADMPAGVLRIKGFVCSMQGAWWELQFAGRHLSMRKLQASQSHDAAVVAIGIRGQVPRSRLEWLFR